MAGHIDHTTNLSWNHPDDPATDGGTGSAVSNPAPPVSHAAPETVVNNDNGTATSAQPAPGPAQAQPAPGPSPAPVPSQADLSHVAEPPPPPASSAAGEHSIVVSYTKSVSQQPIASHAASNAHTLPVDYGFWSAGFWSGHGGMWSCNDSDAYSSLNHGFDGGHHLAFPALTFPPMEFSQN